MNMTDLVPAETTGQRNAVSNGQPNAAANGKASDDARRHAVLATTGLMDDQTRVLKHGDTFAVFDHFGDINPGGLGEEGLYHEGTRYLSSLLLDLEGDRPFLLSSTIRDENDQLSVALTNPDLMHDGRVRAPLGTLHLALKKFLWQGCCYQQCSITNHGLEPLRFYLMLHFGADFADIFEIRGMTRAARGQDLSPVVSGSEVTLSYRGLDGVVRRTRMRFSPLPSLLAAGNARFDLTLKPKEQVGLEWIVGCDREPTSSRLVSFSTARMEALADVERYKSWSCRLSTSNDQANAWVNRAVSDLHMMTTELPTGPFPYAGVPWFNTPFGRDGIVTALEALWIRPALARGVLSYLASTQAQTVDPAEDAEPGKILHETRNGEMAVLKEMPFGRYYGSVDATPLFVVLAGAYFERTADREFAGELWPNIEAALAWINQYGDRDGDGYVEYQRQSPGGLLHQGWKDSDDAVCHADGSPAEGPIALVEVQAYVYAAFQAGAVLADALGRDERAADLRLQAEALRQQFERDFWCDELATYALALDGDKRPCRVRTSNAGYCLFTGIAAAEHAWRVARGLMQADSFSGYGVRTVAAGEPRYNPMSYHNGSIWPHDNALIAYGFARYGLMDLAAQIWSGMFEAALRFPLNRMPELFCGFPASAGEGPILYPVACAPQAWSAASVFLFFQACLGLQINAPDARVYFIRPQLPESVGELRIHNLEVAGTTLDLLLVRHEHDVGVNVLRRDGDAEVLIVK
jgi:glycogen debranching enzyme